jgi:hypothetical protein
LLVGALLPGELGQLAAEVAVVAREAVDGTAQLERVDDGGRAQVEDLLDRFLDRALGHDRRAERVHVDGQRARHADGICQLHLAALGQAGGHDVLGNPARGVGGGTVDLRAVLAAERAAAVTAHAAVGVDDDLAAGQARVAHGAAHNEAAGGVHEDLGAVPIDALGVEDGLDDVLDEVGLDLRRVDVGLVLRGHEHLLNRDRLVVHVAHGDLRLAVRVKVRERAVLAHLGQTLGQAVGQVGRHGHERGGLVAGIAEHDALVARADAVVGVVGVGRALLHLVGLVDAHGDVGRLGVHVVGHGARVGIEAHLGPGVADVAHHVAHDGVDVNVGLGANLAHNRDDAGGGERLDGAAHLVDVCGVAVRRHVTGGLQLRFLGQDGVQDGIGHLVAQLVRVPFGN